MFEVKASSFKIRKFAIQDYQVSRVAVILEITLYQEQGKNLDVIFVCQDGEQRCSRLTLNLMSDFYAAQLEGRDKLKNEPVFTYEKYPKQVVKTFLDIMHCIDSKLDIFELLILVKFLRYEGKSGDKNKLATNFINSFIQMILISRKRC